MASDIKGCRQYPQEAGTCLKGWRGWYSVEPLWKTTPMRGHPFFMTFFFLLKTLKPPDPFYWVTLKREVTLYRKKTVQRIYGRKQSLTHRSEDRNILQGGKKQTNQTWQEAQSLTQRNEDRKKGMKTGRKTNQKHGREHRVWYTGVKTQRKTNQNMAGSTEFDIQEWRQEERNEDMKHRVWHTRMKTGRKEWRQEAQSLKDMNEDRKKDHQNMAGSTVWHTWMKTGRKEWRQEAQSLTHRNEDRKKDQPKHGRKTESDTQKWRQEERSNKTWQDDRVWHTEWRQEYTSNWQYRKTKMKSDKTTCEGNLEHNVICK